MNAPQLPFASPLEGLRQYRSLHRAIQNKNTTKKAGNAAMNSDRTKPFSINLDDHEDPDAVLGDLLCGVGYAPSDPFKQAKDGAVGHSFVVACLVMLVLMVVGSIAYVHFFGYPPAPAPGQGMNAAQAIVAAQRVEAGRKGVGR